MHPNSLEALAKAQQARKKGIKRVNMSLTPTAIASLNTTAQNQGLSRSQLIEEFARGKQTGQAITLLCKLESIPRNPERWDAKTKNAIYYGLEEAIKMVLELIGAMPCVEEGSDECPTQTTGKI